MADATKESDQAAEADALGAGEPLVSSADVYNDMDGRRVIEVKGQYLCVCVVSQPST